MKDSYQSRLVHEIMTYANGKLKNAMLYILYYQMDEIGAEHGLNTHEEALRRRIFFGEPDTSASPVSPLPSDVLDILASESE